MPKLSDKHYTFSQLLQKSAWPFAARKTAQQTQALAQLASTAKSFSAFKKAAAPIVKNYNEQWLKAEYNTAVASATMAERWQKIWERRDTFPNIQYLPSVAASPREAHRKLYFTIRPVEDPFWDIYWPPSAWGCKCDVRPTDEPVAELPKELPPVADNFKNNSGKTGILLKSNQYTPQDSKQDKKIINEARDLLAEYDLYVREYQSKRGGIIDIHWLHDKKQELVPNIESAKILANHGHSIKLLPVLEGRKNPDALVDNKYVFDFKRSIGTRNALRRALKEADEQKATGIFLIMVNDGIAQHIIEDALTNTEAMAAENIQLVWLYWDGQLYYLTLESLLKGQKIK